MADDKVVLSNYTTNQLIVTLFHMFAIYIEHYAIQVINSIAGHTFYD